MQRRMLDNHRRAHGHHHDASVFCLHSLPTSQRAVWKSSSTAVFNSTGVFQTPFRTTRTCLTDLEAVTVRREHDDVVSWAAMGV